MTGSTPLTVLWVSWAAITAVFVLMMVYRSLVGMREEDQLFLSPAESKQATEQQRLISRVQKVTLYAKVLGYTSAALLAVNLGVVVYRALEQF